MGALPASTISDPRRGRAVSRAAGLALSILLLAAVPAFPSPPQAAQPAAPQGALEPSPISAPVPFRLSQTDPLGAAAPYRGDFSVEFPKHPGQSDAPSFLLQKGEYGGSGYTIYAEMGNLKISQTRNTVQDASGRGGRFAYRTGTATNTARVETFALTGAHGASKDDFLVGAAGEVSLLRDAARFKTILLSERASLDTEGRWPDVGARKGDVVGLLAVLDPFQGKLAAETELNYSSYDGDTADAASAVGDSACRVKIGGGWGNSRYSALYERTGPQYRLLSASGATRDTEGVALGMATGSDQHGFDLKLSRYHDNTEKVALFPRLYRYEGVFEYRFKGFRSMPLALQYRKTFIDSTNEPLGYLPREVEEDGVSGRLNYLVGKWDLGLRAGMSQRTNELLRQKEAQTANLGLLPKFAAGAITVAPELTLKRTAQFPSSQSTDQYAVNLGLNGSLLQNRLEYELKGGFDKETSAVPGGGKEVIGAKVKAAYPLARFFKWKRKSSLALKGEFKDINNRSLDHRESDYSLLFSLDGAAFL